MKTKEIAGVIVGLKGNCDLSRDIAAQLEFGEESYRAVDLILDLGEKSSDYYTPTNFSAKGVMSFNETQFYVGYLSGINYIVSNLFGKTYSPVEISVSYNKKSNLKKTIKKYLFGKNEVDAVLSYGLFWYVFQIILITKKMSFVHGACLYNKKNRKTLLIAGTGGCGKTSTALELLSKKHVNYISEDYSIISSSGDLYFNPKPVSIYWTDIEFGSRILSAFKHSLSVLEKTTIFLRRHVLKQNPKFKVSPRKIFNNRVEKTQQCTSAIYVIRTNSKEARLEECSCKEFVFRCVEASIRELKTYTELSNLIVSNDTVGTGFYKYEDLRSRMLDIYTEAFQDNYYRLLYLPLNSSPEETAELLEDHGVF